MRASSSSPRPESNRQPSLYESAALPLCYEGDLEQAMGFAPTIFALATRRSTAELRLQGDPSRISSASLEDQLGVSSLLQRSKRSPGRALGARAHRRGERNRTSSPSVPNAVPYR